MRGCVATRSALPSHRAAMECGAGRDGTTRPRRRPRLRPTQLAECSRVPLTTLRSSRPPSAFPSSARECGGACHTGAAARAGAYRAEAHPPHVSTRRVPAEYPPSPGRSVRMERVRSTRAQHGSTCGVPLRRPCTARVHSLPASHDGCNREQITRAVAISGSSTQYRVRGWSWLRLQYF